MITRLEATLEGITRDGIPALTLAPVGLGGVAVEALVPVYLADRLEGAEGRAVTLHTRTILEGQAQGTSFVPRLIGFGSREERAFFECFTSVKGLGVRKALRAQAVEPGAIAAMIIAKDAKGLTQLPEIGKRLAETMIAELSGKVERYAGDAIIEPAPGEVGSVEPGVAPGAPSEAVAALVALGEQRSEATRKVDSALRVLGEDADTDSIVRAVFGGVSAG